jgi:hypothetical protein
MAFNFEYASLPLILVFSCCIVTVNFGNKVFGSFFTLGNGLGRGHYQNAGPALGILEIQSRSPSAGPLLW